MIAVVGGSLTAVAWALATLSATRAARSIGPWSTSGWVLLIGLAASIPLLAIEGVPTDVDLGALGWLAIAGTGYVAGMVFNYSALAGGKVPVAAPIVSSEGALAAAIAVLAGESVSAPLVLLLALLAGGVFVTALEPVGTEALEPERSDGVGPPAPDGVGPARLDDGDAPRPDEGSLGRPRSSAIPFVAFAVAAAVSFGFSLFAAGRASGELPLAWVASAGRIIGVVALTLPLAVAGRLRLTRAALPFVAFSGVVEVVGYFTFAWGARESIAITAVLASQAAVLAAIGAHVLGERIDRRQWVGVAVVATSVTAITLTQL